MLSMGAFLFELELPFFESMEHKGYRYDKPKHSEHNSASTAGSIRSKHSAPKDTTDCIFQDIPK